jgi:CheY-like chemotaxis protein
MAPHTVFMIDDDPDIRAILRRLLLVEGYAMAEAETSDQALAHLQNHTPAAILLDMDLPHKMGDAVLSHLRAVPRFATIPVILMTGNPNLSQQALERGSHATFVLAKPFRLTRLLRILAWACTLDSATDERPTGLTGVNELDQFYGSELDDLPVFGAQA